jgi:hypothetical protein
MLREKDTLMGLAYDIAKIISGGKTTDDSPYSLRQILAWIRTTYADWLEAELIKAANNGEGVNPFLLKRHECVAVEELAHGECPCDARGQKVYRVKLPKIATFNNRPVIQFVGGKGFVNKFREATAATAVDMANMSDRFSDRKPAWFVAGQSLYIVAPAGMGGDFKAISLLYLPEDPTATVGSVNAEKPLRFNIYKAANPYPQRAVSFIRNKVVAKEGFWTKQTEPTRDETNNASAR